MFMWRTTGLRLTRKPNTRVSTGFPQADAYVAVKPHALVSSIPGLREAVGDKVAFAQLHDACLDEQRRRRQAQQVRKIVSK